MKKIFGILLLLLGILTITACDNKQDKKDTKKKEEEKIVTEEITEGTIEGYNFKEVDEQTDLYTSKYQEEEVYE